MIFCANDFNHRFADVILAQGNIDEMQDSNKLQFGLDSSRQIKVCHVITGLPRGGAQTTLFNLLDRHDRTHFKMDVVSLTETGVVGEMVQDLGLQVRSLDINRSRPNPFAILRLTHWFAREKPDIVQTWMYHSDLIGGIAARLAGCTNIWNIRQSDLDRDSSKRATILTARLCAHLSEFLPKHIVCCSHASRKVHQELGYDDGRMLVIGNGIDLNHYRPDSASRRNIRESLGICDLTPLIGLVARYHPQKDHATFVAAAKELLGFIPDAQFLLCGEGISDQNEELVALLANAGIQSQCHLLGERDDIPQITAALDISVSASSFAEGFSNVLLEAMACAVPCVATDVGDAALIIDNRDQIIQPKDASALANALRVILGLATEVRLELGARSRLRVESEFQVSKVVEQYQTLYRNASLLA